MSKKEEVAQYSNIVFLDDVVGSGETLWRVMGDFCNRFHLDRENGQQLFYACIAPRKHGAARLQKSCNKAHIRATAIWEDDWIAEPAFEMQGEACCQAEKYEKQVGDYLMEPPKSFSRDGNQHKRPSINQLKKKKQQSQESAYAYGRDHREKWYNESGT